MFAQPKHILFLCAWLFIQHIQLAQNPHIDSLKKVASAIKNDTSGVNTLNALARECISYEPPLALKSAKEGLELSHRLNWKKGEAESLHLVAYCHFATADYAPALEYWQQALALKEELNDSYGTAKILGNMGIVYSEQDNFPKALEYYFKAMRIAEKIQNHKLQSVYLGNLGVVYRRQGDLPKALDCYTKALKLGEENNYTDMVINSLGNIAIVYSTQKNHARALEYFAKALAKSEENGRKDGMIHNLGNMGITYMEQKQYEKALELFFRALDLCKQMGDKRSAAINTGSIASAYVALGKYQSAKTYLDKSLEDSYEMKLLDNIKTNERTYFELDSTQGDYKGSYEHYKKYISARDSITNGENTKRQTRLEMQYEFDKKEEATRLDQERKDALALADKRRQQIILLSISACGILVLGFAIFAYRSFLLKKKANKEISIQKQLIEEKQKEILDSIHYARRIQYTLLPREAYINKNISRLKRRS